MGNKSSKELCSDDPSIQDIYESIYDSVIQADKKIKENKLNILEEYFEIDKHGVYTPKIIKMNLNNELIDIPLITLINQNDLKIDNLKVVITPSLYIKNKNLFTSLISKKSLNKIELTIKSTDTCENLERIFNKINI